MGNFFMRKIFLLSVFCFFILCHSLIFAANSNPSFGNYVPERVRLVGSIQTMGRNTIDILDEQDKRVKRFVFLGATDQLKLGDRVRIFYRVRDGFIEDIKKMTPVEYKKDGQNTGYIFKKN